MTSWSDTAWTLVREATAGLADEPLGAALWGGTTAGCGSFTDLLEQTILDELEAVGGPLGARVEIAVALREPGLVEAAARDLVTAQRRDPALPSILAPLLFHKGFHALQVHRLAHGFWTAGERHVAAMLQGLASRRFAVDIHPAARLGAGLLLDHATGLVVGETAVIEDDVAIWQNVCLGSSFKASGDRHPKVRRGAVLGAGAIILGDIEIGADAVVAAGSVVLRSAPPGATVAGAPAVVVRERSELPLIRLESPGP